MPTLSIPSRKATGAIFSEELDIEDHRVQIAVI